MKKRHNPSEKLIKDLCNDYFLRDFVYHSPKLISNNEEKGDVILYARLILICFEIIYRDTETRKSNSTKSFVKKIGHKIDQLIEDYKAYTSNQVITIRMVSQNRDKIYLKSSPYFDFNGIVIVDCDEYLEKLDFGTLEKSIKQQFPICIMKRSDFVHIVKEADTIPDLNLYLRDRFSFLKEVYSFSHEYFRDLNRSIDIDLMALYKMNEYKLLIDIWTQSSDKNFNKKFREEYSDKIFIRDTINQESYYIESIMELIRLNKPKNEISLHAHELANLDRINRRLLSRKVIDDMERMKKGNTYRYFSLYNSYTECWLLFYFQYGGDHQVFIEELNQLLKLKLIFEMDTSGFNFSVFGYGFRKSGLITNKEFDEIFLTIQDADSNSNFTSDDIKKAHLKFGKKYTQKLNRFL